MKEVTIQDAVLRKAASEGMDAFVACFVHAIKEEIGGELTAETLGELNSDQITLLAWQTLHDEVMKVVRGEKKALAYSGKNVWQGFGDIDL